LTLEDVLHPNPGDVHLLSDPHGDDCNYLKYVHKDRYRDDASVVVLSDCGIYWDKPGLKHHSPDLAVIFGVKRQKEWNTFHVKTERVRPSLIIEVTSPSTRVNDVKTKVKHYARAGVPYYVIADASEDKHRRLSLISYKLEGDAYTKLALDDKGRAWLEPVELWLAVSLNPVTGGERLALVDPATGEEIGDYTAMSRAREEAEALADAAAKLRAEAEARADAAEERLRQVEAELRRLRE
jgi:Uma2 family endonuclease